MIFAGYGIKPNDGFSTWRKKFVAKLEQETWGSTKHCHRDPGKMKGGASRQALIAGAAIRANGHQVH